MSEDTVKEVNRQSFWIVIASVLSSALALYGAYLMEVDPHG